jgi:glycosyltransferase involved in cell wall biosynthesis
MITVICSVYNSEEYLPKYLNYVNEQFLECFEIIFVDANSNDKSLQLIEDFKFRDNISVKIIKEKSRVTIYEAWNIAIKNASNKYIVNWNTDDILFQSSLQTYKSYAEKYPDTDLFYGPCFLSKSQEISSIFNIYNWPKYSHQTLLQRCICGPFPLVRKSAIEDVNYFSEKCVSSGDYEMWLKLSKNNYKFQKIPETIGCFMDRPNSVSKQKIQLAQQEDREIQNKYSI